MPKKSKKPIDYKIKLRQGDSVLVIAGKDKGNSGKILSVNRKTGYVIVENINIVKKHQKTRGEKKGGIVDIPAPIHASNLMYQHNGEPTRIGYVLETEEIDGKKKTIKKRIAKSTGEEID